MAHQKKIVLNGISPVKIYKIFKEKYTVKRNLLEQYDKVLERLENIKRASKEMVFNLLNIDDKEALDYLARMSDKELINKLSDEEWLEQWS